MHVHFCVYSKSVTIETTEYAHGCIVCFCKLSSILYGKTFCTINMHLHCHLRDIILDYGPVHSFWLFSFERYNGILGDLPNNHRAITLQLMRKFTQFINIASMHEQLPSDLRDEIGPFLKYSKESVGSVNAMEDPTSTTERTVHLIAGPIGELSWEKFRTESLCPPFKERVLTSTEFEMITQAYKLLYPHTSKIDVNRIVVSSDRAHCGL